MAGPPPPMPPPMYGMPPPMMPMQERTGLPIAGGALLLIAGIIGLIMWGSFLAVGATLVGIPGLPVDVGGIFAICGAIGIIFSIFPLIGGIFAIQRKMWGLGIAGGVLGIFSIGFFIGSILALIGLILVAVSRREFA